MSRVTLVDGEPRLRGGHCATCGHTTVPFRRVCPACSRDGVEEAAFGPNGQARASVELHVSTEGNPAPYSVGLVKLSEGPTVFARLMGPESGDSSVRLDVQSDSDNYWFVRAAGSV
jgi:uncharacterized OB-fold protein